MSENKYVAMMRIQQKRCHRQALDWPLHSVTREGWEREVTDWQAAAEAFEAMYARLLQSTDVLRLLYASRITIDELKAQLVANEAALKKAEGA